MGSWPKTPEEALAYDVEQANLFSSISQPLSSSQFDVLSKLQHLDVSDNLSLNHLPTDLGEVLPNLETLILSGCGFDHLPPCVGRMDSLALADLRGNQPLKSAQSTWLNNAIALQQHDGVETEAAVFILPTSLMTIAAAPLQDNSIKTPATRTLALELARRVVNARKGLACINLSRKPRTGCTDAGGTQWRNFRMYFQEQEIIGFRVFKSFQVTSPRALLDFCGSPG